MRREGGHGGGDLGEGMETPRRGVPKASSEILWFPSPAWDRTQDCLPNQKPWKTQQYFPYSHPVPALIPFPLPPYSHPGAGTPSFAARAERVWGHSSLAVIRGQSHQSTVSGGEVPTLPPCIQIQCVVAPGSPHSAG